ncbi:hypothetical protein HH214_18325 [Mucilaginibacter robiniae]|uniref:Uncharacterized protein n=1 Tax=Mucilaginibacter robiniae TaxID=2728022 RepID=A0A7L5E4Z3_9SPHI|nr:hypothetical protein [Mucilaginibacter robiniae]QJD97688.1 hypothetical protein HH214_18325 [Mucilaginibacter robiniae]
MKEKSPRIYERHATKKFVYLDIKYWILLRDGLKSSDPIIRQLAEKLQQLHQSGKCIFPISDVIYYEIMKQGDNAQRSASIALLDYYSEGLAMATAVEQFQIGFGYWIRKHLEIANLTDPKKTSIALLTSPPFS